MEVVKNKLAKSIISANLEALLEARGLTVSDLARKTKDGVMTVHNAVHGVHCPGAGLLKRLADALDVTTDDLYDAELPKKLPVRA
jgi:transcriptional regulator with XRE-family HTH domain